MAVTFERRLQTLSVFTFSLYMLLPLMLLCWVGMIALLLNPLTMPAALAYLAFIFVFDTSAIDGKRTPFLRGAGEGGIWWKRYCDFFPMVIVKTAHLPASATYVLGYHPHGVISVGAFGCFATHGARTLDLTAGETEPRTDRRGFISLFPAIRLRLLTLSMNFMIPFAREYLLSLGVCDASRKSFRNILACGPGSGLLIVPGGAEESLAVKPGSITLVLAKRKGFVREAILAGACVVPCLSFGENELYAVSEPKSGSLAAAAALRSDWRRAALLQWQVDLLQAVWAHAAEQADRRHRRSAARAATGRVRAPAALRRDARGRR
jgi:2-acylglycerol O-acyltransferase 2